MNKEEICQRKVAIKPVLKLSEVMDVLYLIMLHIDRNVDKKSRKSDIRTDRQ